MTKQWLLVLSNMIISTVVLAQDPASVLNHAFSDTANPLRKDIYDLLTIGNNPVARPAFMKMPIEPPHFSNQFEMMLFAEPQVVSQPDFFMDAPAVIEEPKAIKKPELVEDPDIMARDFRVTVRPLSQNMPKPPAIVMSSPHLDTTAATLKWQQYQEELEAYKQHERNCEDYEQYQQYQQQKKNYEHYKAQESEYKIYCTSLEQYHGYIAKLTQYQNNETSINKFISYQLKQKYYTEIEEAKRISDTSKLSSIYNEIQSLFWNYQKNQQAYQTYLEKKRSYERYLSLLQRGVRINNQFYRIEQFRCEEVNGFSRDDNWKPHPTWSECSSKKFIEMANHQFIKFSKQQDGSILAQWTRYPREFEYREGEATASFLLVPNPF